MDTKSLSFGRARFSLAVGAFLLCQLLLLETTLAYVLPLSFKMRQYAKERAKMGIVDLTVDLEVTTFGEYGEEYSKEARLYLKKDAGLRLVLNAGQPDAALMVERNHARRLSKQMPELQLLPDKDVLLDFFAPSGDGDTMGQSIQRALTSLNIDTKVVGFKRYKSYVLYITGAKSYEKDKPQAWFHKSSGLPFMVRYRTKGLDGASHDFEIWMRNFGSAEAGNWFPGEIEFVRDGKRVMLWRLQKVAKNTSLPDTLFTTITGS